MSDINEQNVCIGIITNITSEHHCTPLVKSYFGENAKVYYVNYIEYKNTEYEKQLSECNLIIIWLNFEAMFPEIWNLIDSQTVTEQQLIDENIELCKKLFSDLSVYVNAHILWFSFEDYYRLSHISIYHKYSSFVDRLNLTLHDMLSNDVIYIDMKLLIAKVGLSNAYDYSGKYRWNSPYSKVLIDVVVGEIYHQYQLENGIAKKCLVLDCDNVLWEGIFSEDGIENIKLGSFCGAYQDFQRLVLSLYYHGIILAVCSKNDSSDIFKVFREHSEMILKEEHIACFQVNWDNKPGNIKKIADYLNIGLDSMVFVDDSNIEIEAVKAMFPEVTTILFNRNTIFENMSCMNVKGNVNTMNALKRNKTYQTKKSRELLKSQYNNYSDFIDALQIKIDFHKVIPIEFSRISELTQRANRCTNGVRYNVGDIKMRTKHETIIMYSLSLSDRFSDLGLVGVFEVEGNNLTLFCLSCRALGFGIEEKVMGLLAKRHKINKVITKPTGKNQEIVALLNKTFSCEV